MRLQRNNHLDFLLAIWPPRLIRVNRLINLSPVFMFFGFNAIIGFENYD